MAISSQINFRIGAEQEDMGTRATAHGSTLTRSVRDEWRTFRRALDEQLTATRAARAISPADVATLLQVWPFPVEYMRSDHLRRTLGRALGKDDPLARRIMASPDLAVVALAWAIERSHCHILCGDDIESAAHMAGIL